MKINREMIERAAIACHKACFGRPPCNGLSAYRFGWWVRMDHYSKNVWREMAKAVIRTLDK